MPCRPPLVTISSPLLAEVMSDCLFLRALLLRADEHEVEHDPHDQDHRHEHAVEQRGLLGGGGSGLGEQGREKGEMHNGTWDVA